MLDLNLPMYVFKCSACGESTVYSKLDADGGYWYKESTAEERTALILSGRVREGLGCYACVAKRLSAVGIRRYSTK
jgi:predicted nucleic acid-binding Zn ribbon protein